MGPGFESPEVHQPTVWAPLTRPFTQKSQASPHDGKASEKVEGKEREKVGINPEQKGSIPNESVFLTQWVHPFPFRTRKLSAAVVKILGWRRPGKITHSRHIKGN